MTPLAITMLVVFITAWCVAVAAWFYGLRYFMPMWLVGFRKRDHHVGYMRRVLVATGVFMLACAVGLLAGGIAEYWGGGWA